MKICGTRSGLVCTSTTELPAKKGNFLYLIQIGLPKNGQRLIKIGTTNNIKRRMSEELRQYKENIKILWISPCYKKFTTLRVEQKTKDIWRSVDDWEWVPNDRFLIPDKVEELRVVVRNEFVVKVGQRPLFLLLVYLSIQQTSIIFLTYPKDCGKINIEKRKGD